MFSSFVKTALRAMRRQWSYSLINVLGLSLGFLASFLILLWVQDELAFNGHYEEGERVYRVMRTSSYGEGQVFTWPAITAKLDDVLDEEYPEIEYASLISWTQNMALARGDQFFRETGIHAGPDFFKILRHDFLAGNPETALERPESIALSEKLARKYFPEAYVDRGGEQAAELVLGQSLTLEERLDLEVTGVYRDPLPQSSYRPDYVLAMQEFISRNDWVNNWGNNGLRMLVALTPAAEPAAVSEKIRLIIQEQTESEQDVLFLQSLEDSYLRNSYENGVVVGGRIDYVRIFALVGIFVLLIAAINFTNLATARASQRTLEVGVRKTFGSGRWSLAGQFLAESVFMALLSLLVAAIALVLLVPAFNTLTGKEISLAAVGWDIWGQFLGIAVITGLAAGWYPSLHLSGFSVIGVLRKNDFGVGGGINLRRALVVFQFTLSVILIVGAGGVSTQLDYIRGKNLGLDRKDVFYSVAGPAIVDDYETFRQRLNESPAVESVTLGSSSPLAVSSSTSGGVRWEAKDPEDNTLYSILTVAHDYVKTMKMELADGRDFSREFGIDSLNVVINERAAEAMGFDDPVGQTVTVWGRTGQIIGVVKNFHFTSLYDPIEPLVMRLEPDFTSFIYLRPAPGQTSEAMAHFGELFRSVNPRTPLETTFLDDQFERTYRSEAVIRTLARGFMVLAIVVACLGLFGLAAFTAARRTKEIGVRKVLGASVAGIVALLSKEFVALVLAAFALAAPVAWFMMNRWLEQFAYRATLGWPLFVGAALALVAVAFVTVSFQSIRAARVDPARSLRAE